MAVALHMREVNVTKPRNVETCGGWKCILGTGSGTIMRYRDYIRNYGDYAGYSVLSGINPFL